ncbi:uncharacterized protein YkuJ [Runella defluvii]|uniref:Uncharacterized protein YkuJ n=1 Tax=Runella defluvii TaxID=370973 RepID=A0A7W5ZSJ5_9BACT|nr:S8 family peptidase [Runella defluvii]MBB3842333.1 uncharacterized protein YkuJ [Runella defluvii]
MAKKNLPVKMVRKRENDQLSNEGHGGKTTPPKWVLKGDELTGRADEFRQVFRQVGSRLREKVNQEGFQPAIIRVKLMSEATAKNHRREISKLFNVQKKLNIIGLIGEDELILKIDSPEDLEAIEKRLKDTAKYATALSAIEDPDLFKPSIEVEEVNGSTLLKVKLFHLHEYEQNQVLIRSFERFCENNGINCRRLNYSRELNIFEVSGVTKDQLEDFDSFDGLYSITEMPMLSLSLDEIESTVEVEFPKPIEGTEYIVVGVLDTGITSHEHLQPWKHPKRHTNFPDEDIDPRHGSMVTGVLLFGDYLEEAEYTGTNGCKVFEAVVYPATTSGFSEELLIRNIREAIRKHHNTVKIWNLSLGTNLQADIHDFSDFAQALDSIQDEYGVLIIKSAGNCKNYQLGKPKSRISKSADSVRSLVVGSIAQAKSESDLAEAFYPSPFTRIGPGPGGIIKPDIVHFGGNTGFVNHKEKVNGVKTIGADGKIMTAAGTSFATPRVSALAAGVSAKIGEEFNPLLIKALIIHNSKHPELEMSIDEKINQTGYGLPPAISELLYNDQDEITLIFQDVITKGGYIKIMDFPFPESLIDNGYFYGQISITLVTSPLLDGGQGSEYCQSNVDVLFGSYDEKKQRDLSKKGIKNPVGVEGNQNLLVQSMYSQRLLKQVDNPFNRERILINHGKFQPTKKWVINLEELTDGNRQKFLLAPKNWFLELKASFRDNTELIYDQKREEVNLEFALIITIRDPKKKGKVYNEVTQLLEKYNFIHNEIRLREEVKIRLNG